MTGVFFVLASFKGFSQNTTEIKASSINAYNISVTYNKTTNLVFPYAIKSVDRGSKDILVQKAIGVENILQVKAAKQGFPETNLTVVTADGSLFAYLVTYSDAPANLSLLFSNAQVSPSPVAVFAKDATTDEISQKSREVIGRERVIKGIKDKDFDITMDVLGLYIHQDVVYFEIALVNNSAIDYDVQSLRLFIQDKKRIKRTASQETEMQPLYVLGNPDVIRHASEQNICIALSKFTSPDKKYLMVQLMEKNGGRHLSIRINNKTLVHSRAI